jgi:hypothetical protein
MNSDLGDDGAIQGKKLVNAIVRHVSIAQVGKA